MNFSIAIYTVQEGKDKMQHIFAYGGHNKNDYFNENYMLTSSIDDEDDLHIECTDLPQLNIKRSHCSSLVYKDVFYVFFGYFSISIPF